MTRRNASLISLCAALLVSVSGPALAQAGQPAGAAAQAPGQGEIPAPLPLSALGDPNTHGVASIVNDRVISEFDVDQRVALVLVTAGIREPTEDVVTQIRAQVLTALQDEILQLEEAAEREITIRAQDIEDSIIAVAEENGFTTADITRTLANAGVSMSTFRRQIAAQLAWNRLIEARYAGSVDISDEEIDLALERLTVGSDQPQFLVSEIFLSVNTPQDEAGARTAAEQIIQQLGQGANFANLARQFSQSASAAGGGDIGWVLEGQLPDELNETLGELDPGGMAGPIRSEGGWYVVLLRDRREPVGTEAVQAPVIDPNAPVSIDRLLLPLPPNAPEEVQNNAMEFASMAFNTITSCEQIPEIAEQVEGAIHMRLGEVNLATLAPQISERIRGTPPGGVVPPFGSQVGIEIFVRCDERIREAIPFVIPTREQVAQQLFVQQMTVLSRSYMRDLRRDAVIEVR